MCVCVCMHIHERLLVPLKGLRGLVYGWLWGVSSDSGGDGGDNSWAGMREGTQPFQNHSVPGKPGYSTSFLSWFLKWFTPHSAGWEKVSFKIRVSSEECIQPSHMHILLNISLKLARAWRMDIREPGLKTDPFVDKWGIRWNFENKPSRAGAALGHRESRQEWWIVWSGWAVKMLEGTRGTSSWESVWAGEFWHREGVCNDFWRDSNNFLELTPDWCGLIWATPSQNSCVVILTSGFLKFKLKKKKVFFPLILKL